MKKKAFMTGPAYEIVAGIVRSLPDGIKQQVADHFAQEFAKRSSSFDPVAWCTRTGGRLTKAETEDEKRDRIMRYVERFGARV